MRNLSSIEADTFVMYSAARRQCRKICSSYDESQEAMSGGLCPLKKPKDDPYRSCRTESTGSRNGVITCLLRGRGRE
jgi:hypothetical protein